MIRRMGDEMADLSRYEHFHSARDDRADLVVRGSSLSRVPALVQEGGPWMLVNRGDFDNLRPEIVEDIADHGYHLDATPNRFDPESKP